MLCGLGPPTRRFRRCPRRERWRWKGKTGLRRLAGLKGLRLRPRRLAGTGIQAAPPWRARAGRARRQRRTARTARSRSRTT